MLNMDDFIFVVAEGKDLSNFVKNKIYACDPHVVTQDLDKFETFKQHNPFWNAIWTDLFIMPLTVPVIEITDDDEMQQALNFVVTFMHQDPYEELSYINRVWVFRENDDDSLAYQFFDLQLN